MEQNDFSLTLATMALTAQLWSLSFPSKHEVSGWEPTSRNVGGVKSDCAMCGGLSLIVAGAASWSSRSWMPVLGSAAMIAFLTMSYSTAAKSGSISTPAAPPVAGRYQ